MAVSCLKVIGLKKRIAKELYGRGFGGTKRSFERWELYHNRCKLSNENTLDECSIEEKAEIQLETEESLKGHVNHQMATGGTRMSTEKFEGFVSSALNKVQIVCRIQLSDEGDGTGFLIGKNKIITNYHVIRKFDEKIEKGKAVFFCGEKEKKIIEVTLTKVDYSSKSPSDIVGRPTKDLLDFSIISFKAKKVDEVILNQLVKIANKFFVKYEYENEAEALQDKRANIIQFPEPGGVRGEKEIAFRENRITSGEKYCLHYKSYTSEGSSGSPVMNDEGELIGLHFSGCKIIDRALFEKLEDLFSELLDVRPGSLEKYYLWDEKDKKDMKVFFRGEDKGGFAMGGEPKKRSLRSFVKDKKGGETDTWILDFLCKQDLQKRGDYEKHLFCNIAIPMGRIFEKLEIDWKEEGGLEAMRKESKDLIDNLKRKEGEDLVVEPKKEDKFSWETILIFGGLVFVGGLVLGYFYRGSKDGSHKPNV